MLALFKTHYSIGKSIIQLDDESDKGGSDSLWDIAKDLDMKDVFLVEDSMSGFLKAYEGAKKRSLNLRFGLRVDCKNSEASEKSNHKLVIFALNSDGCHDLIRLSSEVNVKLAGSANYEYLKQNWTKNLQMVVPYYDSFLFQNLFTFNQCLPDFSFTQPIFMKESNRLPFEQAYNIELDVFRKDFEFMDGKSIYYKNRSDFKAWQTFKCMSRKGYGAPTLEKPELSHCCSAEFSVESWKESL